MHADDFLLLHDVSPPPRRSTVRIRARTVDVHIRRLREKIERNPDEPEFIFTKWKVGYYFTDKD